MSLFYVYLFYVYLCHDLLLTWDQKDLLLTPHVKLDIFIPLITFYRIWNQIIQPLEWKVFIKWQSLKFCTIYDLFDTTLYHSILEYNMIFKI